MSINIRNEHLESRVDSERARRKHATLAGTAEELLIERLVQIESQLPTFETASKLKTRAAKKRSK